MAKYLGLSKDIAHTKRGKTGVVLINLGTPDAPTTSSVRRYLAEFLSDPRVIEIPKLVWMLILHGIILRIRPAKSAELYKQVWTDKGSPLMAITRQQTKKLASYFKENGTGQDVEQEISVEFCMRYGNPSVSDTLKRMHNEGVDKVVVLPLYPQYAAPTTGSVFDAVAQELTSWRYLPSLHFINTYHDHPDFIHALVTSIKYDFEVNGQPQKLVLSYHGMPERNLHLGDPYYCFCMTTTKLVVEQLGLTKDQYIATFQSRFGKAKWLSPYTDETMGKLPGQNIKNIAVVCPAFSADCLETLEEIAEENRLIFEGAGGEKYRYIPALNDTDLHITMMANLVKPYL